MIIGTWSLEASSSMSLDYPKTTVKQPKDRSKLVGDGGQPTMPTQAVPPAFASTEASPTPAQGSHGG